MNMADISPWAIAIVLLAAGLNIAWRGTDDIYDRVLCRSLLYLGLIDAAATLLFLRVYPSADYLPHDRIWYVIASAATVSGLIGWLFNFRYPHLRLGRKRRIIGFDTTGSFVFVFNRVPVDIRPLSYVFVEDGYDFSFSVRYDPASFFAYCLWRFGDTVPFGTDIDLHGRHESEPDPFRFDAIHAWQDQRSWVTAESEEAGRRYMEKYFPRSIGRACASRFGFRLTASEVSGYAKQKHETSAFPALAA